MLASLSLRLPENETLRRLGLAKRDWQALEAAGYRSAPRNLSLRREVGAAVVACVGAESANLLPFLEPYRDSFQLAHPGRGDAVLIPVACDGTIVSFRLKRTTELRAADLAPSAPAAAPVELEAAQFEDLQSARLAQRRFTAQALNSIEPSVSIVEAEMGTGKTFGAIEESNALPSDRSVALVVGRWQQAQQFPGAADWLFHYGVDYKGGPPPCTQRRLALRVIDSGEPLSTACRQCPQQRDCETNTACAAGKPYYLALKKQTANRHVYAAASLSEVLRLEAHVIVDDTDLERASVERYHIDWGEIQGAILWASSRDYYAPAAPALRALFASPSSLPEKEKNPYEKPRLCGQALFAALASHLPDLGAALAAAASIEERTPWSPERPSRLVLEALRRLEVEYRRHCEGSPGNPMVHLKADGITFWRRNELDFSGRNVLINGAWGAAEQCQRLFPDSPRPNVHTGRIKMPDCVTITQRYEGAGGRWSFSRRNEARLCEEIRTALALRAVSHPHESPSDWGIVSFKGCIESVAPLFPGLRCAHYGNQTGSNELEGLSFLIVAGDQRPHPQDFLEEAQAIYGDAATFKTDMEDFCWTLADKAGNTHRLHGQRYRDASIAGRYEYLTVGEVRQAVGRSRPWSGRHLDILLLTSYALPGIVPDKLDGAAPSDREALLEAGVALVASAQKPTLSALMLRTGRSERCVRRELKNGLRAEITDEAMRRGYRSSPRRKSKTLLK